MVLKMLKDVKEYGEKLKKTVSKQKKNINKEKT